jgi:hypothetical protein
MVDKRYNYVAINGKFISAPPTTSRLKESFIRTIYTTRLNAEGVG